MTPFKFFLSQPDDKKSWASYRNVQLRFASSVCWAPLRCMAALLKARACVTLPSFCFWVSDLYRLSTLTSFWTEKRRIINTPHPQATLSTTDCWCADIFSSLIMSGRQVVPTVAMRQLVPLGSNPPPPYLKQSKPLFSLLSAHFFAADAILKMRWGGNIIFSARPPCRTCNTPSSFRPRSSPLQLNKFSSFLSSPLALNRKPP